MTSVQIKNSQVLLGKLSNFGLNPAQWQLQQKSKTTFFIYNKKSPSWYFRGICKNSNFKLEWTEIRLASL